jgi:hypothetical protein
MSYIRYRNFGNLLDIIKKGDRGRRRPYLAWVKAVVHLGVKSGIFISSFYK